MQEDLRPGSCLAGGAVVCRNASLELTGRLSALRGVFGSDCCRLGLAVSSVERYKGVHKERHPVIVQ